MNSDSTGRLAARSSVLEIRPYVPGKPIDEVRRELGVTDVIKLASNENPLGPSPKAIEAICEAASLSHLYPDGSCYSLRSVLADMLGVPSESIVFGCGSDETIRFIAETFVEPGDEVIYGAITFSQYEFVTRIAGGTCVQVPMNGMHFDLDAMSQAITQRTRLVFIANPNNPTGLIVSKAELDRFIDSLPDHVAVVLDEAYYEYVQSDLYPDSIERYVKKGRNVIVLRTLSKLYGLAGLRVGYLVARPELIALIERVRPPFNISSIAQAAAIAALADTDHVRRSRECNETEKQFLYDRLDALQVEYLPSEANFLLMNVGQPSRQFFQQLLQMGVIVRSADIFGLDEWIRVTVGTHDQNERFLAALAACLGR